jgi:hypothetical protein
MTDIGRMDQASTNNAVAFNDSLEATQQTDAKNDAALAANQTEASSEKLQFEETENTPVGMSIKSSKLEKPEKAKTEKAERAQESVLLRKEEADGLADSFSRRQGNREYRLEPVRLSALAQLLGSEIKEDSDETAIINTIRGQLTVNGKEPDTAFVDKTLDFLIEVTRIQLGKSQGPLKERVQKILERLESTKANYSLLHQKDLLISQTIMPGIAAMTDVTGINHADTLTHYRNSINNPQTIQDIRKHCEQIGYKAAFKEAKEYLSFVGGNTKQVALNSREDTAVMVRLTSEIRKMQAIFGVPREAKKQDGIIYKQLALKGII